MLPSSQLAAALALRRLGDHDALARDELQRLFYGPDSPLAVTAQELLVSLDKLTAEDLRAFHRAWYRPPRATFSISGDVAPAEAARLIEEAFGDWSATAAAPVRPLVHPVASRKRRILIIDTPDATSSEIWTGGFGPVAGNPDHLAFGAVGRFLNSAEGPLQLHSVYNQRVRFTATVERQLGFIAVNSAAPAAKTADALAELEQELGELATGPFSAEDQAAAKASMRAKPETWATNAEAAATVSLTAHLGWPLDYGRTLPSRLEALDAAAFANALKTWLKPEQWQVVVIGPAALFAAQIRALKLGQVTLKTLDQAPPQAP